MARRVTIKEETILSAARAVFLARGFQATTAEVAERAGISEGSIFKRFRTKEELFHAAMRAEMEEAEWLAELEARAGVGDVRDSLYVTGMEIIAFMRRIVPLTMMAWSKAPGPDGLPPHVAAPNPPSLRARARIAAWFEGEVQAGRVRRHDPEIVARAFLGALQSYVLFEILHRAHDQAPLDADAYVRGLVELVWSGIAPEGASS